MEKHHFSYRTRNPESPDHPELKVIVRSPEDEAAHEPIDAVVDTGASITVVPLSIIRGLGINKFISSPGKVRLADGGSRDVRFYDVDVWIEKHRCRVKAVAMEKDYILLGRDILNRYLLHLDAPNKVGWIEFSRFE